MKLSLYAVCARSWSLWCKYHPQPAIGLWKGIALLRSGWCWQWGILWKCKAQQHAVQSPTFLAQHAAKNQKGACRRCVSCRLGYSCAAEMNAILWVRHGPSPAILKHISDQWLILILIWGWSDKPSTQMVCCPACFAQQDHPEVHFRLWMALGPGPGCSEDFVE